MTLKQHSLSILSIAFFVAAMSCPSATAQIPGDGIPDIYFFRVDSTIPVSTSLDGTGTITRPAGSLVVDTDGTDMVALLIGSSTDFATSPASPGGTGCELCNNGNLPDPNAPPFFSSQWTAGNINGANQWVRTAPLDTPGFTGVIGEYDDPFDIYPDQAIAYAPVDTVFDFIFDDGNGGMCQAVIATAEDGQFCVNIGGFILDSPPEVQDDAYNVGLGGTLDTQLAGLPGLLDNDFDPDGFPLSAFGPNMVPSHGTVNIASDGSFVYTHDGSPNFVDTFSYFADDGSLTTEGFVTINVIPEPATSVLLLFGVAFLLRSSRARRKC